MGYTHYWTQHRDFGPADWDQVVYDVGRIIAKSDVPLALEYDEPDKSPLLDKDEIRFNGVGDDGHETFIITRKYDRRKPRYDGDNPKWSFCKTAQKPYDVVVTAVLAYLESNYPDHITVTSDGDCSDWEDGIKLAAQAVIGDLISVPQSVRAGG